MHAFYTYLFLRLVDWIKIIFHLIFQKKFLNYRKIINTNNYAKKKNIYNLLFLELISSYQTTPIYLFRELWTPLFLDESN